MARKAATKVANPKVHESAIEERGSGARTDVRIKPLRTVRAQVRLIGMSPLVHHRWSEKAGREIYERQVEGRKSRDREPRNPDAEYQAAMYVMKSGKPAMPVTQIKDAIVEAADQKLGIPKTLVKRAIFLYGDEGILVPIETKEGPVMREDMVRVPARTGNASLRYRPEYPDWAVTVRFEFDEELLRLDDILTLMERAGFGIGAGEWRPEKGGELGRFRVDKKSLLVGDWKTGAR